MSKKVPETRKVNQKARGKQREMSCNEESEQTPSEKRRKLDDAHDIKGIYLIYYFLCNILLNFYYCY